MAQTPEESLHSSAYDRIKSLQGATIPSAAAELVAIETSEAGCILRTSTPDQLKKRNAESELESTVACGLTWSGDSRSTSAEAELPARLQA